MPPVLFRLSLQGLFYASVERTKVQGSCHSLMPWQVSGDSFSKSSFLQNRCRTLVTSLGPLEPQSLPSKLEASSRTNSSRMGWSGWNFMTPAAVNYGKITVLSPQNYGSIMARNVDTFFTRDSRNNQHYVITYPQNYGDLQIRLTNKISKQNRLTPSNNWCRFILPCGSQCTRPKSLLSISLANFYGVQTKIPKHFQRVEPHLYFSLQDKKP